MAADTRGFSRDGYIINQDVFTDLMYRTIPSSQNGCGWIAAYDLRHALGHKVHYDEVRREMDGMHTLRCPGPTLMRVMKEYLAKYVPGYTETVGRKASAAAACTSRAGIFRYTEGEIPHYVAFVKADDGQESCMYRFFNVGDDMLDEVMDMRDFCREHLVKFACAAYTVRRG